MKRSTFLAISGVVLAFFIVSAFGNRNILYEKKENFQNPKEAIVNFIGYANKPDMVKTYESYYYITSTKFLESISKRYRLYTGNKVRSNIYGQIPVLFSYKMEEVDYDYLVNLKNNYEDSFKNIPKYKRDSNPIVYRLDGYGTYNSNVENISVKEDGTFENIYEEKEIPFTIYLILVNEGEGYVVDYYSIVAQ